VVDRLGQALRSEGCNGDGRVMFSGGALQAKQCEEVSPAVRVTRIAAAVASEVKVRSCMKDWQAYWAVGIYLVDDTH